MGRQPIKSEDLREAAYELGIELSVEEADTLSKRIRFKECLEQARTDYYRETGPRISKEQIEGLLFVLAERLAADREDAKASEALLRLAKVKGIVGYEPDSLHKTLSSLNQAEIDEVRRRLIAQKEAHADSPEATNESPHVN